MCAACDVTPAPHGGGGGGGGGAAAVLPLVKAWTGEQFERFTGEPTRESIARWLMGYSDWRLDTAGDGTGTTAGGAAPPGYEGDNSASLLLGPSRGKLQPWTGQALPTQVFVPLGPRPSGGLWPVLVYFHGGNDGPWQSMTQQAVVRASLAPHPDLDINPNPT